jgi:hypothetical protein
MTTWRVVAPATAVSLPLEQTTRSPDVTEIAQKQTTQRDEEWLERHRDWEEAQQERREEEWEEEDREEDRDDEYWSRDRDDDYWNPDRDDDDWDRDDDFRQHRNDDRDAWNNDWFWNWDSRTGRTASIVRLELTSATNDWVTVSIEGLDGEQQLSFNQRNLTQAINLPPGAYRISFRRTFNRNAWESGYLNVGQTEQIRIRFDQSRDRILVYDDPYAWTPESRSPIRIYTGSE